MEPGENGGSFAVDLNENEEVRKATHVALKDCSKALVTGQEAGKGHIYVTGNVKNVNRRISVHSPSHTEEIMLVGDLAEKYLPGRLTDSCVTSGACDDHQGLNGFITESFGPEESLMIGLEGAGEAEGGGICLAGTTTASCPALPGVRISAETGRQIRQHRPGNTEGETPDSDVSPGEEAMDVGTVTGCILTSLRIGRLPCSGNHCACTAADPDVNMPNGDVDSPGVQIGYCKQTGGGSESEGEEVKVANGGFLISSRAACDRPKSDCSTGNNSPVQFEKHRDCSGGLASHCRWEDSPPHLLQPPSEVSPSPECRDKPPSPCPSSTSDVNSDSPLSEPTTGEDEVGFSDLRLPMRPQSLRTNPKLAVSLSCDATPMSPGEDGGFYFGEEDYEQVFRNTLEAGRRQSAPDQLPDQLPDLTDPDCSDPKLMPKRFGIADFFTR